MLDRVRRSIVEGDLALGEPLSERQLAEDLGVSKTPVREALAQLRLEGLVRIYPQRGAFIFSFSAREVIEMCELRLTLEAAALRFAFERNRGKLLDGLRQCVAAMEKARAARDVRAYLTADTAFHDVFFKTCGNTYLADTYALYAGKIASLRTHLAAKPMHTERSFEEHRDIVANIAEGDLGKVLALLDRHIERTKTTYAESIEDIAVADTAPTAA